MKRQNPPPLKVHATTAIRGLKSILRGSNALTVSLRRNRAAADALDAAVKEMLRQ